MNSRPPPASCAQHGADAGHAGGHELVVDHRRLHDGAHVGVVVRRPSGRRAQQDRVVPVVQPGDLQGEARPAAARCSSRSTRRTGPRRAGGPAAASPRPRSRCPPGSAGRCPGPVTTGTRSPQYRARVGQLGDPRGHLGPAEHEQQRVVAERHRHRRAAVPGEPPLDVLRAVLAGHGGDGRGTPVGLDLHPVAAAVVHAGLRVAGDHEAAGADEPAAVVARASAGTGKSRRFTLSPGTSLASSGASSRPAGPGWSAARGRPRGRFAAQRLDQAEVVEVVAEPQDVARGGGPSRCCR